VRFAIVALLSVFLACAFGGVLRSDETKASARRIGPFNVVDVEGRSLTRDDWRGAKYVLLFFLATECPVSNSYSPLMERFAARAARDGARCYGIHCDPTVTAAGAARHAKRYSLTFPIVLDHAQALAEAAGVQVTPEAVVATPEGEVLYRGRIDNRYALDGKRRDVASVNDLQEALDAVVGGKRPSVSETKAFGCPLVRAKAGPGVN
jgi:peroxiredoxin